MNPIDSIDALPGPQALSALSALQSMAAALPALAGDGAQANGAHGDRSALEPGALATPAVADEAAMNATALPGGVAEAQAQQGLAMLGRMAAESAQVQPPSPAPLADAASRAMATPDAAPRPELLSVPVFVPPWQPPASDRTPWPARTDAPRRSPPRDEAEPEPEEETDERSEGDEESPAPELTPAAPWLALLRRHAQTAALREIDRARRLLLVLPQAAATRGAVAATAILLGATQAPRWRARWWPGTIAIESEAWQLHRVFRADAGDHLLVARASAPPCRVVLGPWLPHVSDPARATLEIAERQRFVRALGLQWSVTLLVAPPGMEAASD